MSRQSDKKPRPGTGEDLWSGTPQRKPTAAPAPRAQSAPPDTTSRPRPAASAGDLSAALGHYAESAAPPEGRRERRERDRQAKKAAEREDKAYRQDHAVSLRERAQLHELGVDFAKGKAKDGATALLTESLVEDGVPRGAIDAAQAVKGHADVVGEALADNKSLGAADVKRWLGHGGAGAEAGAEVGHAARSALPPTRVDVANGVGEGLTRGAGLIGGVWDICDALSPSGSYQERQQKSADTTGRTSQFLGGALDVTGALAPNIPAPVLWAARSGIEIGAYGNKKAKEHGVFTDDSGEHLGADDYMANVAGSTETWAHRQLGDGGMGTAAAKVLGLGGFVASAAPAVGGTLVGAATGLGEDTADAVNSWRGVRMPKSTGHTAQNAEEREQAREILHDKHLSPTGANMNKVTLSSHDEVMEHANEVEILESHDGRGEVCTDHIDYGTAAWQERQRQADAEREAAERRRAAPFLGVARKQQRAMDVLVARQQGNYNARTGQIEDEQAQEAETMRLIHNLR